MKLNEWILAIPSQKPQMKLKYNFRDVLHRIKNAISKGEKPRERDCKWLRHSSKEKDIKYMSEGEIQEMNDDFESKEKTKQEAITEWRNSGLPN